MTIVSSDLPDDAKMLPDETSVDEKIGKDAKLAPIESPIGAVGGLC